MKGRRPALGSGFEAAPREPPEQMKICLVRPGKPVYSVAMRDRLVALSRCGFYLSVLLVLYGTLFPFHFDFSPEALRDAWSGFGLVPFWDVERGRIHSLPDMAGNILLTVPMGFFGLVWVGRDGRTRGLIRWFFAGFLLGLLSECIQLGVASRLPDITDAICNGIGALSGAVAASLCGEFMLDLLSGSRMDRLRTHFFILAAIILAGMLLPFDFTMDISGMRANAKALLANPWESGTPVEYEWIQMAEFAILGAIAGTMKQRRIIAAVLAMPFVFEGMQILVESHSLSLRDPLLSCTGVILGLAAAGFAPKSVRPETGFALMTLALVAQGLSPYRFGARDHFEWIPLAEHYARTTGGALFDAMAGLMSYGLMAALWPRRLAVVWAIVLSGGIEAAQIFVPTRSAGVTDVLMAGIGAWIGYSLSKIYLAHAACPASRICRSG